MIGRKANNFLSPFAGNFIQTDKDGKSVFDEKDNKNKVIVEFIGDNQGNYLVNKVVSSAMDNKSFGDELKDRKQPLILNSKGSINQNAIDSAAANVANSGIVISPSEPNENTDKIGTIATGLPPPPPQSTLDNEPAESAIRIDDADSAKKGNRIEDDSSESSAKLSRIDQFRNVFLGEKIKAQGGYDANKRSRTIGSKRKTAAIRQPKRPNRRSRRYRISRLSM